MLGNKRSGDHDASGSIGEFLVTFIFEGGIEITFMVVRFIGHAVVAMLAGILHL